MKQKSDTCNVSIGICKPLTDALLSCRVTIEDMGRRPAEGLRMAVVVDIGPVSAGSLASTFSVGVVVIVTNADDFATTVIALVRPSTNDSGIDVDVLDLLAARSFLGAIRGRGGGVCNAGRANSE